MTDAEQNAVEARIRAFEARTGAEAVAAIVDRSDRYHGLRWRAFAFGASVAALLAVVLDLAQPNWSAAHASLTTSVAILASGLACTVLATFVPSFERLFLQRERAEAEARQRARSIFLERELFATPARNAVLLLASRYERAVAVLGDRAFDGRIGEADWQGVVDAMRMPFRAGREAAAFSAGLDALEALLVEKGFRPDDASRDVLSDRLLEPGDDR